MPQTTIQFNITAVKNSDVIFNVGDVTQNSIDTSNSVLLTQTAATSAAGATGQGLPDDGFFAANTFHPDMRAWSDTGDGLNAWSSNITSSMSFNVSSRRYREIHIAATGAEGDPDMEVTFNYTDSTSTMATTTVPDWTTDITPTADRYYLINNMDSASTTGIFQEQNNPAVFGLRFLPDPTKTLSSITIRKAEIPGQLFVFAATGVANLAIGDLDPNFGTDGKVVTDLGATDQGFSIAVQPDGKILVAGESNSDYAIARYNADGSLDQSFGNSGIFTMDIFGGAESGRSIVVQADGKIVVAGQGSGTQIIARYNSNGSLDTSFAVLGGVNWINTTSPAFDTEAIIQPDGKIVVAGGSLIRYTSNGVFDTSFNASGSLPGVVSGSDIGYLIAGAALQPDGKIIIVGRDGQFRVSRYNSDGSIDSSFGTNGTIATSLTGAASSFAHSVALQADGKIVVAGFVTVTTRDFAMVRYNADGSLDSSFGTGGQVITDLGTLADVAWDVKIQPDGKIVLFGVRNNNDAAIVRYSSDGSLDSSFGTAGRVVLDFDGADDARSGVILPTGKILIAGVSDGNFALARFEAGLVMNVAPTSLRLSSNTLNENVAANTVVGMFSSTDPNPSDTTFTYSLVPGMGDADNAAFSIAGNQLQIVSSPDFETQPNYSIRVRTTDQGGLSFDQVFTVTITDQNDAPTAIALSNPAIAENAVAAVVGNLTVTDPDTSDTHTFTVSDNRFEIIGTQLKLKAGQSLNFETEPTVNLSVTATDAGGLNKTQNLTLTVTNVNETPTAIALSSTSIAENAVAATVGNLTVTDLDASDAHTFTVSDNRFEVVGNQLRLKAGQSLNFETEPTINLSVTATDAGGLNTTENFSLTITNVNEVPTAIALSNTTVTENAVAAVIGNLTVTDLDASDAHTFTVSDNRFEVVSNQLKLKAGQSLNFETEPTVNLSVIATDAGGLNTTENFSLTITNVNEVPTAIALSSNSIAENAVAGSVGNLLVTDSDASDTHTFTVSDTRFEVVGTQLKLKAGQSLNFETEPTVNLTVTATDAGGLNRVQNLTLTVTNVNEVPTAIALSSASIAENVAAAVVGNLTVTDPDASDTHTFTVSDTRFEVVGTQLKLKAGQNLDFETEPSINLTVTAIDTGAFNTTQSFTLTVTNSNDAPTSIALSNRSIAENDVAAIVGDLTVTDPDTSDTHTFTVSDARFEVVGNQLKLKAEQSLDFETTPNVNLTVTATDAGGQSSSQLLNLTVTNVSEPPTEILLSNTAIAEKMIAAIVGTLSVKDPNAGSTYSFTVEDPRFEIVSNQLKLKSGVSLDREEATLINLSIAAIDSATNQAVLTQFLPITVTNINEAPTAITFTPVPVNENAAGVGVGSIAFTDVDVADTHTLSVSDTRFEIVNRQLKLKAGQSIDFETESSIPLTITVTDAEGLTASGNFILAIANVNETPTAIDLSSTALSENQTGVSIGTLSATDPDANEQFTYRVSDGRFTIDNGQLFLRQIDGLGQTPSFDFETTPSTTVDITAIDAGGLSRTQAFTINVLNVNESPTAILLDNLTVSENLFGAMIGRLSVTDPDANDSVTFTVNDDRFEVVNGQLKLKSSHSLNFEVSPTMRLNVTTIDRDGLSLTREFNLSIVNQNDPPTAITLSSNAIPENLSGAAIGTLQVIDEDRIDLYNFTVSDARFEVVNGQLKLKDNVRLNYESAKTVSIDVTATDAAQPILKLTQNYSIVVGDVNEPPTAIQLSKTAIDENQTGDVVGRVTVVDPDANSTYQLSVNDARFEIVNSELKLKSGQSLDFETTPTVGLQITATDLTNASLTKTEILTIQVRDRNEAPTAIQLDGVTANPIAIPSDTPGVVLGTLQVADPDANNTHTFTLSDSRFEVVGTQLKLKDNAGLDFALDRNLVLGVAATDNGEPALSLRQNFNIQAQAVNPVQISLNSTVAMEEGNQGRTTLAVFTVSLSRPSAKDISVQYSTVDGTAKVGSDYTATTGTLRIGPGETSRTIAIRLSGDSTYEADETLTLRLSSAVNAVLANNGTALDGVLTIRNDDPLPTLIVDDLYVPEPANGVIRTEQVKVRLTNPSDQTITTNYFLSNTFTKPTITFQPGMTEATIPVAVTGNTSNQPIEFVRVSLVEPTNATIGDGFGFLQMVDDDRRRFDGWVQPYVVMGAIKTPSENLNGLTGEYYSDRFLRDRRIIQTDATIDFNWNAPPSTMAGTIPADGFSVRWRGQVQTLQSGEHTFTVRVNDGARLWVNNELLIDRWQDTAQVMEYSGNITLEAGKFYDIKLEYYDNTGNAFGQLLWSAPGLPQQIIPQSQLYGYDAEGLPANVGYVELDTLVPIRNTRPGAPADEPAWIEVNYTLPSTVPGIIATPGINGDYLNSQYRQIPDNPETQLNSIIISRDASKGKIYFTVNPDAIAETTEAIILAVQPGTRVSTLKTEYFHLAYPTQLRKESYQLKQFPGVYGEYYNSSDLSGAPVLRRTDSNIYFDWGASSPAPGVVNPDNFSVRWSGYLRPNAAFVRPSSFRIRAYHDFFADTDDGTRLWLNEQLLINDFTGNAGTRRRSIPSTLDPTAFHPFLMEYREGVGNAKAKLNIIGGQTTTDYGLFKQSQDLYNRTVAPSDFWTYGSPEFETFRSAGPAATVDEVWQPDAFTGKVAAGRGNRWTGYVRAPETGNYIFKLNADDGVRLWINDRVVIDDWNYRSGERTGVIQLEKDRFYSIKVEHFQAVGSAFIQMKWVRPDPVRGPVEEIVPANRLFTSYAPDLTQQTAVVPSGQLVPASQINLNATSSPATGVNADNFGIRWTGKLRPYRTGNYTLYAKADEGVRVYINGQLRIDQWLNQTLNEFASVPILLEQGKMYDIRVETYDTRGGTTAELSWSSDTIAKQLIPASVFFQPDLDYNLLWGGNVFNEFGLSQALIIADSRRYSPGILFLDADNQPVTALNPLFANSGNPTLRLRLTSQPASEVKLTVLGRELTFTAANWDQPQLLPLTNVTGNVQLSINATGPADYTFTRSIDLPVVVDRPLRVQEGQSLVPSVPSVQLVALGNVSEISDVPGQFIVKLNQPAPAAGFKLNYVLNGNAQVGQDYQLTIDGIPRPLTGEVTIAPGTTSAILAIEPQDDFTPENAEALTLSIGSNLSGLTGEYFDNSTLSNQPIVTRLDPNINFVWGNGSPDTALPANGFSVRWTGRIVASKTGNYTFLTQANDGVRLSIDGRSLIDRWSNGTLENESAPILLQAGQSYPIQLEYYDNTNAASMQLLWRPPGENKQVIPSTFLLPRQLPTATLTIQDDDQVGVEIVSAQAVTDTNGNPAVVYGTPITAVQTAEDGSSQTIAIKLKSKPSASVNLSLANVNATEGTIVRTSDGSLLNAPLQFTPDNWNTFQTVTIKGIDDRIQDGDAIYSIVATVASPDSRYNGTLNDQGAIVTASTQTLRVTNIDTGVAIAEFANPTTQIVNGTPVTTYEPLERQQTTEGGQSQIFAVRLRLQPTQPVTLNLSGLNPQEGSLSTTELTFTLQNWDTYQPVRVTGVDDQAIDGDINSFIQVRSTSSDGRFNGFVDPDGRLFNTAINAITVTNADNEGATSPLPKASLSRISSATISENVTTAAEFEITLDQVAGPDGIVVYLSTENSTAIASQYRLASNFLVPQSRLVNGKSEAIFTSPFAAIDVGDQSQPTFADLDGDGDLDAIVGTATGALKYLQNQGSAASSNYVAIGDTASNNPVAIYNQTWASVKAPIGSSQSSLADLEGDGDIDLLGQRTQAIDLLGQRTQATFLHLYTNSGTAKNPQFSVSNTGIPTSGAIASTLADLDGNRSAEIVVVTAQGANVYSRNTAGAFAANAALSTALNTTLGTIPSNAKLTFTDWDKDGDLDLFLGQVVGTIAYYRNTGTRETPAFQADTVNNPFTGINVGTNAAPSFADLDGDGDLDAIAGRADGTLFYAENFAAVRIAPGQRSARIPLNVLDDLVADGDKTVQLSIASLPNANYSVNDSQFTAALKIQDNDAPGIEITPSGTTTTEAGGKVTLSVKLISQPTALVQVSLGSNNREEALLNSSIGSNKDLQTLVFTSQNWNQIQTVEVVGADDSIDDETQTYRIVPTVFSEDAKYRDLKLNPIAFTNQDNDTAAIDISTLASATEGRASTLAIQLKTQPTQPVQLTLTPSTNQVDVAAGRPGRPRTLTFDETNWNILQTIEFIPLDDQVVEGLQTAQIDFSIDSADVQYQALNSQVPARSITILDNDLPVLELAPGMSASELSALPGYFAIRMTNGTVQNSEGLVVNYRLAGGTASNGNDFQALGSSIRIAPGMAIGNVMVVPIDDKSVEANGETVTLELLPGNGYTLGKATQATIKINDDDQPGIQIIQPGEFTQVEEGTLTSVLVSLLSVPDAPVTITLNTSRSQGEAQLGFGRTTTAATETLTFTKNNWFIAQPVYVQGIDDGLLENGDDVPANAGDRANGYHRAQITYQVSSTDSNYNNFTLGSTEVRVFDRRLDREEIKRGLENALDSLQNTVDQLTLPVIGDLKGKTPTFLKTMIEPIVAAVDRELDRPSSTKLGELVKRSIEAAFPGITVTPTIRMDRKEIAIDLRLQKTYNAFTIPVNAQAGLPGFLELQSNGNLAADFNFDLNLSFGIHKDWGFFVDAGRTKLDAGVKLALSPDWRGRANLAFLQFDAVNLSEDATKIDINFKANLKDLDSRRGIAFLDTNNNDRLDPGEPFAMKDADGRYTLLPQANAPTGAIGVLPEGQVGVARPGVASTDQNRNGKFEEKDQRQREGIYRRNGNEYYFDANRDSQRNTGELFTTTSALFNTEFSFKETKNGTQKAYYFDANNNDRVDPGELLSQATRQQFDKNNNLRLEADINVLGEGKFVTDLGIAFLDRNNNQQLDAGERYSVSSSNSFDLASLRDGSNGNVIIFETDGDRLTLSEMRSFFRNRQLKFQDLIDWKFSGEANLGLRLTGSFAGSAAFPSVNLDLKANQPIFNYGNLADSQNNALDVRLENVQLNFGTFITKVLKPFVQQVDQVIEPIKPIVRALNADTKLLGYLGLTSSFDRNNDGQVSILEIARTLATVLSKRDQERIDKAIQYAQVLVQIVDLIDTMASIPDDETLILELGDYTLEDFQSGKTKSVANPERGRPTRDRLTTNRSTAPLTNQVDSKSSGKSKNLMSKLKAMQGLELAILEPDNILKLLLGDPAVDIVKFDTPDLDFSYSFDRQFPIYSPPTIRGLLDASFNAKTDFSFGFDTQGISDWAEDGYQAADIYKIFDGFYLNDLDAAGNDKPELSVNANFSAGLSISAVVAKATVRGGVQGMVGLDLEDVGEKQGTSDGKIRGSEIISRISNPLDLFELYGAIEAYLNAKVQIGIDMGFFEIMKTVWQKDLARFKLAEFRVGNGSGSRPIFAGRASDGYLIGAEVFLDANFNGIKETDEPSTATNSSSEFTLELTDEQLKQYDKNQDGKLDRTEARIVVHQGIDAATGEFFPGMLVIPLEGATGVVTPLTTLLETFSRQANLDLVTAQTQLLTALNLPTSIDLLTYDPLAAIATGAPVETAAQVYAGAVKVVVLSTLLATATGDVNPSSGTTVQKAIDAITTLIQQQVEAGQPLDWSNPVAIASTLLTAINPQLDPQVKTGISQIVANLLTEITAIAPSLAALPEITKVQIVAQQAYEAVKTADTTTISQVLADFSTTALETKIAAAVVGNLYRPTGNDKTMQLLANNSYTFRVADFGFQDQDANSSLTKVQMSLLPAFGQLLLRDQFVSADQEIAIADIQAGMLQFKPFEDGFGDNYGTIGFKLSDGSLYSTENRFTFHVAPSYRIANTVSQIAEGDSGKQVVIFTVSRDANTSWSSLNYQLSGTALNGTDYTAIADQGTLTFEASTFTKDIAIEVVGDTQIEPNETITVSLFDLATPLTPTVEVIAQSTITITNDDSIPPSTPDRPRDNPTNRPGITLRGNRKPNRLVGTERDDRLFGLIGNDRLLGQDGDDRLLGGAGKDRLVGGNGNDILSGEGDLDVLIGGTGKDQFILNRRERGVDRIVDFSVQEDVLLVRGVKGAKGRAIAANQLRLGTKAVTRSDRLIYNARTGTLSYDADGTGRQNLVAIGQLSKGMGLTAQNILTM